MTISRSIALMSQPDADELGGQPVEQLGMAGRLALRAEIVDASSPARAEEHLPVAVDRHPRRQRVGRIDQPAGQAQPVGRPSLRPRRDAPRHAGRDPRARAGRTGRGSGRASGAEPASLASPSSWGSARRTPSSSARARRLARPAAGSISGASVARKHRRIFGACAGRPAAGGNRRDLGDRFGRRQDRDGLRTEQPGRRPQAHRSRRRSGASGPPPAPIRSGCLGEERLIQLVEQHGRAARARRRCRP